MLSPAGAIEQTKEMLKIRDQERPRLKRIRDYLRDDPDVRLPGLPAGAPTEVQRLARVSRVNMLKFVVNSSTQSLYVDGYRAPKADDNVPAWETWQRNRFDARQIGVHRAACGYGAAYVTVLPGSPAPVMRGKSPWQMTVAYGDDDEWPRLALERTRSGQWRLLDDTHSYWLSGSGADTDRIEFVRAEEHGATYEGDPVVPVVRYRPTDDLDDPVCGQVEPLIPLQDQINITTFGLQVAQHYGAFRQRYILGWLAETEEEKLRASASKLWTFEDHPDDVKIGEFEQTNLSGYIDSREATLRHLATVSQTPAHELLGQLVNLSAEALAAANESKRRMLLEFETTLGESHEQALSLAGEYSGDATIPDAEVRWRDTESRSLNAVADALGKLATMLHVPVQELWEKIPGVSQTEVERWKARAEQEDALATVVSALDRQSRQQSPQQGQPVSNGAVA